MIVQNHFILQQERSLGLIKQKRIVEIPRCKILNEDLLNQKQIRHYSKKLNLLDIQINAAKTWLKLMKEHKLNDEKSAYMHFADYILQDLIGLRKNDTDDGRKKFYIYHEKCRQEFLIKDGNENIIVGIELKGMDHKNLFKPKTQGELSPIEQSLRYMKKNKNQYGICSNYDTFILLTKNEYYKFCFSDIFKSNFEQDIQMNVDKLKDFLYVFSTCLFPENSTVSIEKLIQSAIDEEHEITKKFYDVYHKTRIAIIISFKKYGVNNPVDNAQKFLDQLLFIMFAEDKHILGDEKIFHDQIIKSLSTNDLFETDTTIIFDAIKNIMKKYNNGLGNRGDRFKGFNGELFGKLIDESAYFTDLTPLDDELCEYKVSVEDTNNDMINSVLRIRGINPIIHNIAIMDSYDFTSEGSVRILGHVFEQSISDLETLNNTIKMKRKNDAVYYTPSLMTDYISRITIIGYLSKTGQATMPKELLNEYIFKHGIEKGIAELEKKIASIKILDPACGSGAFLINAADVLVEIRKEIKFKLSEHGYTLDEDFDNKEFRKIIKNHVFGADINDQSVEIAKLSIFFKIIEKRALPSLTQFITGDSLMSPNSEIDSSIHMIDWSNVFSKNNPKFDVIIGNPPWDKLKPTEDDFFGPLYEREKANPFHALSAAKKTAFISRKKNEGWDERFKIWQNSRLDRMKYFLCSGEYRHIQSIKKADGRNNSGDLNTYQLFIERAMQILKPGGYLGMVLPTALFLDEGSIGLRKMLLEDTRIKEIFDFKNQYTGQKKTFPDVDSRYRFCILIFRKNSEFEIKTNNLRRDILAKHTEIRKSAGKIDADVMIEKYRNEIVDLQKNEAKNSKLLDIMRKNEFFEKRIAEDYIELIGYKTEKKTIEKNSQSENGVGKIIKEMDEKINTLEQQIKMDIINLKKSNQFLTRTKNRKSIDFKITDKLENPDRKNYDISICKCENNNIESQKENAYKYNSLFANHSNDYEIPIINKKMVDVLLIIRRHPTIREWGLELADEIHMTNNKSLFRSEKGMGCVALWKGEMFHQFDNNFAKPVIFAEKSAIIESIERARIIEKRDAYNHYRLVHRIQTNSTNERTMIATILPPKSFLTNSIQYVIPDDDFIKMTYLCGMFNTMIIDYFLRSSKINTNINQHHVFSIPVKKFDANNQHHTQILKLTAKLLSRNPGFSEYRKKMKAHNIKINKMKLSVKERIEIEAEINAHAIIDYGFTDKQCDNIFSAFPIEDGDRDIKIGVLKERIMEHIQRLNMKKQK